MHHQNALWHEGVTTTSAKPSWKYQEVLARGMPVVYACFGPQTKDSSSSMLRLHASAQRALTVQSQRGSKLPPHADVRLKAQRAWSDDVWGIWRPVT